MWVGTSERRLKTKGNFQARFKGKISLIDKEGHLGVAMKQSCPIEKVRPRDPWTVSKADRKTAETLASYTETSMPNGLGSRDFPELHLNSQLPHLPRGQPSHSSHGLLHRLHLRGSESVAKDQPKFQAIVPTNKRPELNISATSSYQASGFERLPLPLVYRNQMRSRHLRPRIANLGQGFSRPVECYGELEAHKETHHRPRVRLKDYSRSGGTRSPMPADLHTLPVNQSYGPEPENRLILLQERGNDRYAQVCESSNDGLLNYSTIEEGRMQRNSSSLERGYLRVPNLRLKQPLHIGKARNNRLLANSVMVSKESELQLPRLKSLS